MAVDSTPGRNIVQGSGVGGAHFQGVARRQPRHCLLRADHRHRAQQVACVENLVRHKYQLSGT